MSVVTRGHTAEDEIAHGNFFLEFLDKKGGEVYRRPQGRNGKNLKGMHAFRTTKNVAVRDQKGGKKTKTVKGALL
jgi:hypothetical protein